MPTQPTHQVSPNRTRTRRIAISAVLAALAMASAYHPIPNVEVLTLILYLLGILLGNPWSPLAGGVIAGLYSLFSPYGVAPLPMLAGQIVAGGGIALMGTLAGRWPILRGPLPFLVAGLVAALGYELLVQIPGFLTFQRGLPLWPYLLAGLPFTGLHLLANAILFSLLGPLMVRLTLPSTPHSEPQ